MAQTLMTSATEVNPNFIPYIMNEANSLARLDEYEIDSYMDRELLNPEMQDFLNSMPQQLTEIAGLTDKGAALTLSLFESRSMGLFDGLRARFRNLKRNIRRILCEILGQLEGDGTIDWPTIITAVLTALAAAFFTGPVGVVVLPILVAFIAKIIRRGIDAVCAI